MCNDFFTYLINEKKVLHVWGEGKIPVLSGISDDYAFYNGERLAVRIDLCEPEVYSCKSVYEYGVPENLIVRRGIMFLDKPCLELRLKDILNKALHFFYPETHEFAISGVVISQAGGHFLNIYDGLLDNSVPSLDFYGEKRHDG